MGGAAVGAGIRECRLNREQAMQTLISELALMLMLLAVVVISGRV
jgi:hypothetical protein